MIKIIKGTVIKWKQLGRKIWFPTANILYVHNDLEDASYKINVVVKNQVFAWAWVFRKNINIFEAHIFDFDEDIYGEEIEIIIFDIIRLNQKVDSIYEVKALIESDIEKIQSIQNTVITFWTFDTVHDGHNFYLSQAKKYGDTLITILATDKNVEKIKWHTASKSITQRMADVTSLWFSDLVIEWNEENHLEWLETYKPQVVCLWYDQSWFFQELIHYMDENNIALEIIRIPAYKPDKYKSSIIKKS